MSLNTLFQRKLFPLLLLFLCVLSYSLLAPWMGFYGDDWSMVWVWHSLGSNGLQGFFAYDRPFLGWVFPLSFSVLGESPIRWQLFFLVFQWLSAMTAWWLLRGLWPERPKETAWIAAMFSVYPGFTLQPLAITTGHIILGLTVCLFSFGAMIWALRQPSSYRILTILALLSSALSFLMAEYYVGLEFTRPLLIWIVIAERASSFRQRLFLTLKSWAPYLGVFSLFLVWRLFFFKSLRTSTDHTRLLDAILSDPISELGVRLRYVLTDLVESTLLAWGQTFQPDILDFGSRSVLIAWMLVILSGFITAALFIRTKNEQGPGSSTAEENSSWAKQALTVGLIIVLVGGLPTWFAKHQLILNHLSDRFGLASMIGACIFLVGLAVLVIRTRLQQVVFIGILIALSVGFNFRSGNRFRSDWSIQSSLFWQLSWRIPGIEPGTALLIDQRPSPLHSGYGALFAYHTFTHPLNFIYAPDHRSTQLDYFFFNLSNESGKEIPLRKGVDLTAFERNLSFNGTTSNTLAVWFSPPSCLRVLDASIADLSQMPPVARDAGKISDLSRILLNPDKVASPPPQIFGAEPRSCWCYYFQKADLARQKGEWQLVAELGDEARQKGFKPEDMREWVLFIEGYVNVGRYKDAKEIAAQVTPKEKDMLQALWIRLEASKDVSRQSFLDEMKSLSSSLTP